jgi:hypothetical protein
VNRQTPDRFLKRVDTPGDLDRHAFDLQFCCKLLMCIGALSRGFTSKSLKWLYKQLTSRSFEGLGCSALTGRRRPGGGSASA